MADLTPNVNTPSAKYLAQERMRLKCRHLMQGVETLKANAAIYLPRNPSEVSVNVNGKNVDPWQNRVDMSRLNNLFQDAVDECVGKAFAKPVEFDEDTPPKLEEFFEDVDGRGTDLQTFAMSITSKSASEGIGFVLVDYPPVGPDANMLAVDEERNKLAPFWRRYDPESIIDWEFDSRGREQRLMMIRARETHCEPNGPWAKVDVPQVRVIYAGNPDATDDSLWTRWEVWRPVKRDEPQGEWVRVAFGTMRPQVDIPLVDFPTDLTGPFEAVPPFLDLAHLTIALYQKTSDLDNAQHAVGYPVFHWAGGEVDANGAPIGMGPNRFLVSRDPQAHAEFVEPEGTSWSSLIDAMDRMEKQGKALATEPMETGGGALTATGEAIRAARATSKLAGWVLGWQNSLNTLCYYTAQYMGLVEYGAEDGFGGVKLNSKFIPTQQNVEGARLVHDRNVAGKTSDETAFEALQAAELLPAGLTFEDEQERLSKQGPVDPNDEDRGGEDLTADPKPEPVAA